jgi:tyrosine-protein phosphatase OCA1
MAKIVPPINFGLVEDGELYPQYATTADKTGFYRSAQPTELNFSFLEKLKLRSLIWVGAEEPSEML